jgi:hypothetical protein
MTEYKDQQWARPRIQSHRPVHFCSQMRMDQLQLPSGEDRDVRLEMVDNIVKAAYGLRNQALNVRLSAEDKYCAEKTHNWTVNEAWVRRLLPADHQVGLD